MRSEPSGVPHRATRPRPAVARAVVPLLMLALLPLLAGCPDDTPEPLSTPAPTPVHLVVLGDSLSAGHQSGCTVKEYKDLNGHKVPSQANGYAYLIAKQAGWDLKPPYIGEPGARPCMVIGSDYDLFSVRRKPVSDPDGVLTEGDPNDSRTWGKRLNRTVKTRNLSSPGMRMVDADLAPPDPPPGEYHWPLGLLDYKAIWTLIADTPDRDPDGSMLKQAEGLLGSSYADPLVAILWLGSNDVLWSAFAGSDAYMTPAADFDLAASSALAALWGTGAHVFVGTVPDLTVAPHFMSAEVAAGLFLAPGPPPFVPLSVDTPTGLGCTFSELTGLLAGDYIIVARTLYEIGVEFAGGCTSPQLDETFVLRAAEVANIQARIAAYNASITVWAGVYGATVVDVAALLTSATAGYPVGVETLGTGYCDGIFSLDGLHPSNLGYAAVANEFIDAINTDLSLAIPLVDEVQVRADEPRQNQCLAALP